MEHLSFERTVSSNPRQVGIRSPVLMNALDSIFSTREVGTGERTVPVWILSSWCSSVCVCVCVCVWGMSGCVLEIPQYKVHVAEIWEKGTESGTYKRWVRKY